MGPRGMMVRATGCAVAAVLLVPLPALAKSFDYDAIRVDITVARDGSFRVREVRTYDFDGSFSRGFIEIDRGEHRMSDARVSEGTVAYRRVDDGTARPAGAYTFDGDSRIEWYFRAAGERRTFTVSYRIAGRIVAYDDVAEFLWKFLGDDRGVRASYVVVTMSLPTGAAREDVRAWGHGPLEGEVAIVDGATVRWELTSLGATELFEGRVAFPSSLVPGAPSRAGERLPEILEVEERLADVANAARRRSRIWNVVPPGLALASLGLFVWLFVRYGREPETSDPGPYLRELPADYPPAIVGYLMSWGKVGPTEMVATVMDLARRGYVSIDEERSDKGLLVKRVVYEYRINIVREPDASLRPYEREVVDLLAAATSSPQGITDDELKGWARANPSLMQASMMSFREAVRDHGSQLGLIHANLLVMTAHLTALLIAGAATVLGLIAQGGLSDPIGDAPGVLIAFVVLLPQVSMTRLLRRRTARGATDHARWLAFKRFLTELTRMSEYRPSAVTMWEQYLVYAVPLGVAKEVSQALKLHAPPEMQTTGFAWYAFGPDGGGPSFGESISTFTDSFTASATAAFATAPSSGSGGGGGFSGGGGGGGGGGGSSGAD